MSPISGDDDRITRFAELHDNTLSLCRTAEELALLLASNGSPDWERVRGLFACYGVVCDNVVRNWGSLEHFGPRGAEIGGVAYRNWHEAFANALIGQDLSRMRLWVGTAEDVEDANWLFPDSVDWRQSDLSLVSQSEHPNLCRSREEIWTRLRVVSGYTHRFNWNEPAPGFHARLWCAFGFGWCFLQHVNALKHTTHLRTEYEAVIERMRPSVLPLSQQRIVCDPATRAVLLDGKPIVRDLDEEVYVYASVLAANHPRPMTFSEIAKTPVDVGGRKSDLRGANQTRISQKTPQKLKNILNVKPGRGHAFRLPECA